jgi:hypothetical protein
VGATTSVAFREINRSHGGMVPGNDHSAHATTILRMQRPFCAATTILRMNEQNPNRS